MDSIRFDTLSREVAAIDTRRGLLKSIAATGLGLGLARIGLGSADAKKKKKKALGARCSKNDQCGGGLDCKVSNSQNGCYPESEKRCCKPIGAKCDDGCDCCGVDVICNGGYCQGA